MLYTSDLCDAHEAQLADGRLQILGPGYQSFGRRSHFAGPAFTLRVDDDNSLVRHYLEQPGEGQVLVVDGNASPRYALLGGQLAALAVYNGWAGLLVHGCVRDRHELDACDIGIRALGLHPRRTTRRGEGEHSLTVAFGDVRIAHGAWIYADEDAVLVADTRLHP